MQCLKPNLLPAHKWSTVGNKMFLMRSRKCSLFHFTLIFGFIIWLGKKAWVGPAGAAEWFWWPEMTHLPISGTQPRHCKRKCTVKGLSTIREKNGSPQWLDSLGVVLFFKWKTIKLLITVQKSFSQVKLKVEEFREVQTRETVAVTRNILVLKAKRFVSLNIVPLELLAQELRYYRICLFSTLLYSKCTSGRSFYTKLHLEVF